METMWYQGSDYVKADVAEELLAACKQYEAAFESLISMIAERDPDFGIDIDVAMQISEARQKGKAIVAKTEKS